MSGPIALDSSPSLPLRQWSINSAPSSDFATALTREFASPAAAPTRPAPLKTVARTPASSLSKPLLAASLPAKSARETPRREDRTSSWGAKDSGRVSGAEKAKSSQARERDQEEDEVQRQVTISPVVSSVSTPALDDENVSVGMNLAALEGSDDGVETTDDIVAASDGARGESVTDQSQRPSSGPGTVARTVKPSLFETRMGETSGLLLSEVPSPSPADRAIPQGPLEDGSARAEESSHTGQSTGVQGDASICGEGVASAFCAPDCADGATASPESMTVASTNQAPSPLLPGPLPTFALLASAVNTGPTRGERMAATGDPGVGVPLADRDDPSRKADLGTGATDATGNVAVVSPPAELIGALAAKLEGEKSGADVSASGLRPLETAGRPGRGSLEPVAGAHRVTGAPSSLESALWPFGDTNSKTVGAGAGDARELAGDGGAVAVRHAFDAGSLAGDPAAPARDMVAMEKPPARSSPNPAPVEGMVPESMSGPTRKARDPEPVSERAQGAGAATARLEGPLSMPASGTRFEPRSPAPLMAAGESYASPTASRVRAPEPAPPARGLGEVPPEIEAAPISERGSLRELRLEIRAPGHGDDGARAIRLELVEQNGRMEVALRTTDPEVASDLRQSLPVLVERLGSSEGSSDAQAGGTSTPNDGRGDQQSFEDGRQRRDQRPDDADEQLPARGRSREAAPWQEALRRSFHAA